jgi:hypothetical protein
MAQPQVPIDVDPETGIWRTDGLPMIYLPRHFLVNMQKGIEAAIGPEAYREILYASSDLSALQWCRAEAKTHAPSRSRLSGAPRHGPTSHRGLRAASRTARPTAQRPRT